MKTAARFVFLVLAATVPAAGQESRTLTAQEEAAVRARYPSRWDVPIPEGTALAALKSQYDRRLQLLAATDTQDQSPYPAWFRAYLRANVPELPTTGLYQYPRVAAQILEWMLAHPNLTPPPPSPPAADSANFSPSRVAVVGTNINVTNLDERTSESFIAVNYAEPRYLTGASNNISGSGRQKQFRSADGGATWSQSELPLAPQSDFHSDPALAWSSDGTAWAATLGIRGSTVQVQAYKSTDRGATWSYVATVSTGGNNDKELMWIDPTPTSPHKDNIYVVWDAVGGGMRFARSTDGGAAWSSVATLSTDAAIGSHLTTGPAGELYVAWPDTSSREIRIRKSTDGGATFAPQRVIARANDSYEVSIPAMCGRKVLVYVSLAADRSSGPNRGAVYAAWTDRSGAAADPDCTGIDSPSNANIYFSRSTDGGNTWSSPKIVHADIPKTDQFNQWLDVDPTTGKIHVTFYDTRDDAGRVRTHLYHVASNDGGNTWIDETRVTTHPTDETAASADLGNQYGDYNGLVAYRGVAHPIWTDRRAGVPGDKEQIFTAAVSELPMVDIGRCTRYPWLCVPPQSLASEEITLSCPFRSCVVIDPIPTNCLVKYDCPGCAPGGLCPPFYHIFLDGLENAWSAGIFDVFGEPVPFQTSRTSTGIVLSFQPKTELFIDKQVGDYFIAFQLTDRGKPGASYKIKTRLKAADKHFGTGISP